MTAAARYSIEDETGEAMVGLVVAGAQTNGVPTLYVLDTISPDDSINLLEKSKIQVSTYNRYTNQFLPWLIAGIIFLFIEILLRYTFFKKFP
ncbi:MAG: hypothetical protein ABI921_06670, partial [Panacibacter sp.]